MRTSVLIPSLRRPASLEACLRSLAGQSTPPDEVIVVWQGDDEPTRDLADRVAAETGCPIRAVHLADPGIVPAENAALDASSGDVILLIDDDAVAPPGWLARHVAFYDDPTVGAVGGPAQNYEADGTPHPQRSVEPVGKITWYGRFLGNMHSQPESWRARPPRDVDQLVGYNMSLRRSAFDRFEEGLRRYWQLFEADACLQVRGRGYRVVFDFGNVVDHYLTPRVSVYSPGRTGDFGAKFANAAYNAAYVLSKHSPAPSRWARRLYLMAVGTSTLPGPLLLPLTILRHKDAKVELRVLRMVLAAKREGWRDGRDRRAAGPAAVGATSAAVVKSGAMD